MTCQNFRSIFKRHFGVCLFLFFNFIDLYTEGKMYGHGMLMAMVLVGIMSPSTSVYWTFSNKPVIYGEDIILTCETGHILKDASHCPVRQWFGGPHNKLLLYNEFTANASKYVDNTDLNSSNFSLVIKHWKESDINLNYTCSCGFKSYTKPLLLSEKNFIVLPKTKHVKLQETNMTLSVELQLERTYPKPECYLSIGTKEHRSLVLKSKGNAQFDDYESRQEFKVSRIDCHKPKLVCQITNITIIEKTGDSIGICTGNADDKGTTSQTTQVAREDRNDIKIWAPCISVIIFMIICFVLYRVKKGKKQCRKSLKLCGGRNNESSDRTLNTLLDSELPDNVSIDVNSNESSTTSGDAFRSLN